MFRLVALGSRPAASWSWCKGSPSQEMSSAASGGCNSEPKKVGIGLFFSMKASGH